MVRFRHLFSGCALAVCVAPALAQAQTGQPPYGQSPYGQPTPQPGFVNPFGPQSDADLLAQQMRRVAASPTDLYALLTAARLSLKVGDIDAAAALYTRAERINPMNAQVKAGMARLLVQSGRPGAAMRKFQEAERAGATLADFGPDRALAYDLIGDQQRAQREYRALLKLGADDETTRRYALSLGITGLKEPALALLDPLNRRSDRGAWRARAFVLAMTGDRAGADRIATTMMPPGMAKGLDPFFDRLPRLSATERAFAVSFGETRASPTRLADARLVPSLPALAPEPNPFPQVRSAAQLANADDVDDGKKRKKRRPTRGKPEPVRVARQSTEAPLPAPPAPTATQLAALSASRAGPRTFMPTPSGGRVTMLPPPPDAYRGGTPQIAAAPLDPNDGDEPDFAVAAVSALAGRQAATRAPGAAAPAGTPVRNQPAPTALASAAPVTRAANSPYGDRPAAGSGYTLAGSPVTPAGPTGTTTTVRPSGFAPATTLTTPPAPITPTAPAATPGGAPPPGTTPTGVAPAGIASSGVASSGMAPGWGQPGGATVTGPAPAGSVQSGPVQSGPVQNGVVQNGPIATTALAPSNVPSGAGAIPAPGFSGYASGAATAPAATQPVPVSNAPAIPTGGALGTVPAPSSTLPSASPPAPVATAAISAATGAPPAPQGTSGDDALAAIVAAITVPAAELTAPIAGVPPPPATPPGTRPPATRLLANIDAKAAAAAPPVRPAVKPAPASLDPTLPKKDARGRFVDDKGKLLLDPQGRPMGPKGAAAWQLAQTKAEADEPAPTAPQKDARGRYVDTKGKPLLDAQGRPMGPKGAAAWQLAQNKLDGRADASPTKPKADPSLPRTDARGRFVDDAGKPLLDARGRAMTEVAARAWKTAQVKEAAEAKKEAAAAKSEPQRYWVQVAGGANEGALGREWSRISAASPALKGKQGWTMPLRATHRVLTGPFKTSAEAATLVNQLKKEGQSAFMVTSEAGQKVTRLTGK